MKAQGVRPRVWFGERWITSVFDLFEENLTYFPALLPVLDDEDPVAELGPAGRPTLRELRLHNGTVWRWNRPSTTSSTAGRTSAWRTACSRPARPSSTPWPTVRSTSARCATSPG